MMCNCTSENPFTRKLCGEMDSGFSPAGCPGMTESSPALWIASLRNDEMHCMPATYQPDGQINKNLSIPSHQNIPLAPSGKSVIESARLTR
jgi:hypothetical protein